VGPPGINVHNWEVCHRESQITVSSGCPDSFDKTVYTGCRNENIASIKHKNMEIYFK
jgi:hypothetical protein